MGQSLQMLQLDRLRWHRQEDMIIAISMGPILDLSRSGSPTRGDPFRLRLLLNSDHPAWT
jgi:hypothetical protein